MGNQNEQFKPYKPEEPVDEATRQKEREQIREAGKHAAQEMAAEELGPNDKPMSHEQAEKQLKDAVRKVKEDK